MGIASCTDWIKMALDGIRTQRDIHEPPGPPVRLQVDEMRGVTSKSVWLKWQAPNTGGPCTGYEIEISRDNDSQTTVSVNSDKKCPIVEVNDLDPLEHYSFRVRAVVDMIEGDQKKRLAAGDWCPALEVSTAYLHEKDEFSGMNANFPRRGQARGQAAKDNNYVLEEEKKGICSACSLQ